MDPHPLGSTGLSVTPIGFGAFKIGRNVGIKYPRGYDLPSDDEAERLLHGVLDLGIRYIDTAPAYGIAEERIGRFLADRAGEFTLSTKVGEVFENGRSCFDFSEEAIRASIERSRQRLRRDVLDLVLVHSDGRDLKILRETPVVEVLQDLKAQGVVRAVGFSGKTIEGARAALDWADALMVEYHLEDRSHEPVIAEAERRRVGVIVKKGLASGRLDPAESIRFVLGQPGVDGLVIGGLNLEHIRQNLAAVDSPRRATESHGGGRDGTADERG